jgi:RNA polymerase sigma-70 factor (ECF subfamily)
MDRFTPLIRGVARRSRAWNGTADDLVQETMIRLWRSADRFDPSRGNEGAFVATVARNTAVDLGRRTSTRASGATVIEDETTSVSAAADDVPAKLAVRAALDRLSAPQRHLLRLAYFEQLTQTEIADRLGLPLGTVKSRTFQALRALRVALRDS